MVRPRTISRPISHCHDQSHIVILTLHQSRCLICLYERCQGSESCLKILTFLAILENRKAFLPIFIRVLALRSQVKLIVTQKTPSLNPQESTTGLQVYRSRQSQETLSSTKPGNIARDTHWLYLPDSGGPPGHNGAQPSKRPPSYRRIIPTPTLRSSAPARRTAGRRLRMTHSRTISMR